MNIKTRLKYFDPSTIALIWEGRAFTYGQLILCMEMYRRERWKPGSIVSIYGNSWLMNLAKLFFMIDAECIVVPMVQQRSPQTYAIEHEHYCTLRKRMVPGLVLFTSGSSGVPKVAVHDLKLLLSKWKIHDTEGWKPKKALRTMFFLGFDHIGGLNTIFHVLFNGGTLVIPSSRQPAEVAEQINRHSVEVLPTSPTFLRMLLMAYDGELPSLKLITYGTEPMPETTLKSIQERWPAIELKQTYGLTELGILGSRSKDGSTWMQVGGAGYETKIVESMLYIKAKASMLGYLNAPSPVIDGWYSTGDIVEQEGEWIRIVGRKSEFINVGGDKVHPTEIEDRLLEMAQIDDCMVEGIENPILGQAVRATVKLKQNIQIEKYELIHLIKTYLRNSGLSPYQIPQQIIVTDQPLHNERLKKARANVHIQEANEE